jgi:hypothetical protein
VHKKRGDHRGIMVSVEGSVMTFVVGAWLWGVVCLGAQSMVSLTSTTGGAELPGYVLACSGPQGTEKKGIEAANSSRYGCPRDVRSNLGSSRQPGAGLKHVHRRES